MQICLVTPALKERCQNEELLVILKLVHFRPFLVPFRYIVWFRHKFQLYKLHYDVRDLSFL